MNTLINAFSKNTGVIARWLTALIVGGITAAIARLGLEMSPADTAELSTMIGLVVGGLISEWILTLRNKNVAAMQAAVQIIAPEVDVDGDPGPVTTAAIVRAVEHVQEIKEAGVGGTKAEKAAAADVKEAMKPAVVPPP